MSKLINLTGQKFNKLTVLYKAESKNNKTYWHCKCDCGKELDILGYDLRRNHTTSCGCKRKNGPHTKDLIGLKFFKLTVLEKTSQRKANCIVWKCKCDCGTICYIDTASLTTGNTKSCGCLKSIGEETIANILTENNIPFKKGMSFESCKYDNGYLAYFDFYVNNEYLIEYDGIQHFLPVTGGWNTSQSVVEVQKRDKFKNDWCMNHKIPLIRIPYTHLNDLILDDLILERSHYVI